MVKTDCQPHSSFADGNGDGIAHLAGACTHLVYLKGLGVDAVWFTPWYLSALGDGGYDLAHCRAIDPAFGRMDEAEALITEAAALDLRIIVDIVSNQVPDQHVSFKAALTAGRGSPERERLWFHPGKCEDGSQILTHWVSSFQGSTWTRTADSDGRPGEREVPAPVHPAAARCELEPLRCAASTRRSSVLVRPRRRRHPDRLDRAVHQGPAVWLRR